MLGETEEGIDIHSDQPEKQKNQLRKMITVISGISKEITDIHREHKVIERSRYSYSEI